MFESLDDFSVTLNNRIFVNRTLNLNAIKVVGFDMDYTLVLYDENALEDLAFRTAIEHLIETRDFPQAIRDLKFDASKIIRGLVIDKKHGNLVKINRFGYIKAALHGDRFLTHDEQKALYSNEIVTFTGSRFVMVHTMFSLAACSLFCQLVDRPDIKSSYEDLYNDVSDTMDEIHRNGSLKTRIVAEPHRYVLRDEAYADTLKMLKASGKKLVLITNSDWDFTKHMMTYAYDSFLEEGEPGKKWLSLFSVVVTDAAKPQFFTAGSKFFEVIPENGHLKNVRGPLAEGKIYQGGNAIAIEKLFNVKSGGDILYVGDHIYSDVYQSKKASRWRTMLVITELEAELVASDEGRAQMDLIRDLMENKERLELQLAQLSKKRMNGFSLVKALKSKSDEELSRLHHAIREQIAVIDQDAKTLIESYNSRFNPHWGELMWAGNDKSHFGMIIERFACIHASKVSNLLYYSPYHYFRPKIRTVG